MRGFRKLAVWVFWLGGVVAASAVITWAAAAADAFPVPAIDFAPRRYVCYRAPAPLVIDGHLDEAAWKQAALTEEFLDIEGDQKPAPRFHTAARMLWDDDYLYLGATLEEPDLFATLATRDAVIFRDPDFEVFLDPDGDSHLYYELEMNALNTVWDLLLVKPYRDSGAAVDAWDIQGLKTAVSLEGTLNHPGDKDTGWTVELALPWKVLKQCAGRPAPPLDGDQWRINFSRVEWRIESAGGAYRKVLDPASGQPYPEDNWVWSPQGLINMHYPEMWGFVQFSTRNAGSGQAGFVWHSWEDARWALRQFYYRQMQSLRTDGRFPERPAFDPKPSAGVTEDFLWPPRYCGCPERYEAILKSRGGGLELTGTEDSRIWLKSNQQK
jgi:hypothetical protein